MDAKTCAELLTVLRPKMPRSYRQKIVEMCEGVSFAQVKNFFACKPVSDDALTKILAAANQLAKKELQERKKNQRDLDRLTAASKRLTV